MPVAYAISNLVISASTRPEAFGRVAIEAQAMKKCVIATNIGGSLETIIDRKTGFLVESGNVEKMAESIDEVLMMPEANLNEISSNARKHIEENFSSKKMCAKTIEIYREMLQ